MHRPASNFRALLLLAAGSLALLSTPASAACGELVTLSTHANSTTRYAWVQPQSPTKTALVLLPGGGGNLNLDSAGCPSALKGNSLVRSLPLFQAAGFATALVDAPSNYQSDDGLVGFRVSAEHADDLGRVIADVRKRSGAAVWLVGTSRGTLSAVNAAARLKGAAAPDGIVLTSALMVGTSGARKPWVAQTVFDIPLEAIKVPVLMVGHEADFCLRSPASRMVDLAARITSARQQVVTVRGAPSGTGPAGLDACEGRTPHGFLGQEAEVAAGIARFVRGGAY